MIDIKRFSGQLNIDDGNYDIMPAQHTHAKNIEYVGGERGLTAQNIKGNYLITNSNLPVGTNQEHGKFFDEVGQRIIWANYNSNGNHGFYQLLVQTGVISQIFLVGINSATDVLNFHLDYPLHSMVLVYRTEGDGDLLYWTDGYNRPKYLNLDTVAALTPFTAVMLYAAKTAPLSPPTFPAAAGTNGVYGYFTDFTINYNAVRNKQFRFAYRWVFKNGEKSTLSPISIVPLSYVIDPNLSATTTTDNYIKFIVYSPNQEDYLAIEIFGQESTGTTWGDFFMIDSLDRTDYNIPVNSSYTYSFYNDGSYIFLDPTVSDLYYDSFPDKANTLEILNGNVLIYGGITDGYPKITRSQVNVTLTSSVVSLSPLLVTIPNSAPVFKWGTDQRFGLVYFDERSKTNGVVSFVGASFDPTDFAVTTPSYLGQAPATTIQVPQIQATINHTPPTWATSYQWVRADLTPKFLQWVSNDYQSDSQFLYFGIEALVQMNAKNKFIPSYEYAEGDRIRLYAKVLGDNSSTTYDLGQDFPILGVVQRLMTSPATLGAFIKVPRPAAFPTPMYAFTSFMEIYTPKTKAPDNQQLFYEWGEKYDIYTSGGIRYHRGQTQDQTASLAATFAWTNGDVYLKRRGYFVSVPIENNTTYSYLDMMDANWNDYVATASNANGRAWAIDENAQETYNGVLVRWGGKYQSGTNLNGLNRFRPNDFDEVDRAKGDIQRFKSRDRILRVFQDRGVGQYGVYARFIQNNSGVPELVTTNEIITTNNIKYYQGVYGLCGYPTNLVSTPNSDYFTDVVTGRSIRLSGDGITDLGMLYKGQYYFPQWVLPYNKTILKVNGSIAKVMGYFDNLNNEYHVILEGGTLSGTTYPNRHFSFNEPRNAYCCDEYDFHPEEALSANGITYSFKNGGLWKHDVSGSNYCNFYGTQYDAELTIVSNLNITQKKSWQSLMQTANTKWDCPLIYTDVMSYGTQRQETNLVEAEFTLLEGKPSSAIKRDSKSRNGKINGDFMKGSYLSIKFRKQNANTLVTLVEVLVNFADSPLNGK